MAQVFDLGQQVQRATQIQGLGQANKIRQQQLRDLETARTRAQTLAGLRPRAIQGDAQALNEIAAIDPAQAQEITGFQSAQGQQQQQQLEATMNEMQKVARLGETLLQTPMEQRSQVVARFLPAFREGSQYRQRLDQMVQNGEAFPDQLIQEELAGLQQIQQIMQQEEFATSPIQGIGPDGQPAFVQVSDRGNTRRLEGVAPPPKSGQVIEVTGPDGQTIRVGSGNDLAGMSSSTRTGMEKEMVSYADTLSDLQNLEQQVRPEFLEFSGRIEAGLLGLKDRAGVELDPEERQYLRDYSNVVANANRTLSTVIKQLSGAAVNASEEARLRSFIPTPEDGPTQFQAKLQQFKEATTKAYMRRAYMLRNNMLPEDPSDANFDTLPLDDVPRLYNRRFDRALREVTTQNPQMPSDQARARAHEIAGQEFGL